MWHEARRSEKKVHDMMDAARKRAQRRAIYLAKRRGDPQQSIQAIGSRCRIYRDDALYQATEDQQGLYFSIMNSKGSVFTDPKSSETFETGEYLRDDAIPWNGKQDTLIDRFDGRALLDFIRDASSRHRRAPERTEEEEELEEFVNFQRYRDLVKHRRRGFKDEEGLQHVNQEMDAKTTALLGSDRPQLSQPSASKGSYSQVGFSYDGEGKDEAHFSDGEEDGDDDDDDEEEDFNSDDSNDEVMESIAKDYGVKRYGWLVYMDKKAKEEERRQREVIKGDPAIRKLSRKERRKASQLEREKEREAAARITGSRVLHHDPYRESRRSPTYEAYARSRRSRSRSLSYSPPHSRRYGRGGKSDDIYQGKERTPKIEYITEFGGADDEDEPKIEGYSPPPSPPSRTDPLNRPSTGRILEVLHVDPASGVSIDKDKSGQMLKTPTSASSALSKLNKTTSSSSLSKQQGEKKETPQERLKRIMSKQLNKQIKKDTAIEIAKKREQEKQRLEKLAETSRVSRYRRRSRSRSYSRSPRRHRGRSPSRERSSRRYRSRSRSCSRSRTRSHSHSPSSSRSLSRSISRSRSPRRRRSRY